MKIQVILGSTRPGRITERLARWVLAQAQTIPEFEVELVDLADYPMPMFDEPISPRYNPHRTPNEPAARFLEKIGQADGYVVVSAEYNYSMPAVLKNAFDYLDMQVVKKPFTIVSHGTVGGARATEHLRSVISTSKGVVIPEVVAVHGASELFDAAGTYLGDTTKPYGLDKLIITTLGELKWWTVALKTAREQAPTPKTA